MFALIPTFKSLAYSKYTSAAMDEKDSGNGTMSHPEQAHFKPAQDVESQDRSQTMDLEEQQLDNGREEEEEQRSAIKGLGWLDRLLALWILLAMMTGILLGNFVDNVGPALHKGEFVGVSVPIGECSRVKRVRAIADYSMQLLACSS